VVDRPARLLGRLAGHRDDLGDLLRAEAGRLPGPGGVVEEVLQGLPQWLRGRALFGASQVRCRRRPAAPPVADGRAGQARLSGDGFHTRVGREGQDDGGASGPALVGGLLSPQA
jgi:hypothetical protein